MNFTATNAPSCPSVTAWANWCSRIWGGEGAIADCEVLLTGGMGAGAYESMKQANIRPVVTDVTTIIALWLGRKYFKSDTTVPQSETVAVRD